MILLLNRTTNDKATVGFCVTHKNTRYPTTVLFIGTIIYVFIPIQRLVTVSIASLDTQYIIAYLLRIHTVLH